MLRFQSDSDIFASGKYRAGLSSHGGATPDRRGNLDQPVRP